MTTQMTVYTVHGTMHNVHDEKMKLFKKNPFYFIHERFRNKKWQEHQTDLKNWIVLRMKMPFFSEIFPKIQHTCYDLCFFSLKLSVKNAIWNEINVKMIRIAKLAIENWTEMTSRHTIHFILNWKLFNIYKLSTSKQMYAAILYGVHRIVCLWEKKHRIRYWKEIFNRP